MTNAVDIRECILDILRKVMQEGKYSHLATSDAFERRGYLDKKERALITRIVEGTLENLIQIDYYIDQFSKVPVKKMKPAVRCILQSAVYQICYMDGVPDAAACNEAVKLAKKKGFLNLSGFINGVLRNISRNKDSLALPDKKSGPERYLSVRYSIPEWMIRMWESDFSYDLNKEAGWQGMVSLLSSFEEPPQTTILVNTVRITPSQLKARLKAEGVTVQNTKLSNAFRLSGYDQLFRLKSFEEGLFYAQDISPMLAMEAVAAKEGDFIIDVCAAPGGKALYMAWRLNGTGRVLARDLTKEKTVLLLENKNRCQADNLDVQVWDAAVFDPQLEEKADIVIADLPCSGLGVLRRKKDIRYKASFSQCEELAKLQREILSVACRYVKPDGKLVYSTCTINRMENEENARWFLSAHPKFQLLWEKQYLPGDTGGDGFYSAAFCRI